MLIHRISRRLQKTAVWLRGWFAVRVLLPIRIASGKPIVNLDRYQWRISFLERREFSQNGEDGILQAIFEKIGTTNRYYVEFGVEDGMECNTRYLFTHEGWKGLLMDGNHEDGTRNLQREFITAENVEGLFNTYVVPQMFDLLSIDVDGNDYWIWNAVTQYKPRVVLIEYNACLPYELALLLLVRSPKEWALHSHADRRIIQ